MVDTTFAVRSRQRNSVEVPVELTFRKPIHTKRSYDFELFV